MQEQNKNEWASSVGLRHITSPPREGEPPGVGVGGWGAEKTNNFLQQVCLLCEDNDDYTCTEATKYYALYPPLT